MKQPHLVQVELSLHWPEQSAIVTVLSLMNPVHMLPEEGVRVLGASKYNDRHIKVNMALSNKTCVLDFCLFY